MKIPSVPCPPLNVLPVSLGTAAFIVAFDNRLFWHNLMTKLGTDHGGHWLLALMLGVILVLLLGVAFSLIPLRSTFKPLLIGILLTAAAISYFSDAYGAVIDKSMIHNILETNVQESGELLTPALFWHLLLYGGIPALIIVLLPVSYPHGLRGWLWQGGSLAGGLVLAIALFMANYKGFVLFGRANRDLQVYLNPSYPVYSLVKVFKAKYLAPSREPLRVIAADAARGAGSHRTIMVLVVGETARASELTSNGYRRNTTPYTRGHEVINFTDVSSCGTATAESVPCMFSALGRDGFSPGKAARTENLLDILQRTGVKVVWRDNDSGSKGVADRVVYEDFSKRKDARLCSDDNCFDEVLLDGLGDLIRNSREDLLVVLHIKGSHGPAYYKRSPAELKAFLPECTQDSVQDCPRETIVNAYDNTIVYTDYVLGKVIELLQEQVDDSAMLYLSDHGESLGENGIYLHGLPYALAPAEQTHVPLLFWGSGQFYSNHLIDKSALLDRSRTPVSQDNLFHTLLGVFQVKAEIYRMDMDLLSRRKQHQG